MCLAVYVASAVPLPTIPWDEARPAFHVRDATDGYFSPANPLRAHSRRPFFYALGSHDGCGCGFRPYGGRWGDEADEYVEDDSPEQAAAWRALADYLTGALGHRAAVEVFTFCSGDESCPPKSHRRARPADFLTDRTLFDMWQAVEVSEQEAEPRAAADRGLSSE